MSLHDVMDDAADHVMAGRRLDPEAILARAGRGTGREGVDRNAAGWRAAGRAAADGDAAGETALVPSRGADRGRLFRVALIAAAVVGLLAILLPADRPNRPEPAQPPTGPGTVPRTLYLAPSWTPDITEKPISRAVYVVSSVERQSGSDSSAVGPWLVGADEGEYRTLPIRGGQSNLIEVVLSADGRQAAWAQSGDHDLVTEIRVVEVATGAVTTSIDLPGELRRGVRVDGLVFDPTGERLAFESSPTGDQRTTVTVIELQTGLVRPVCLTTNSVDAGNSVDAAGVAWSAAGELLANCVAAADPALVRSLPAGVPDWWAGQQWPPGMPGRLVDLPMVSADGEQRWNVKKESIEDPAEFISARALLIGPNLPTAGVDLGIVNGAEGLVVSDRGVVVTRWSENRSRTSSGLGPADVALVPVAGPQAGRVEVLSTVDGNQARVIAVAADVVSAGGSSPGVLPGYRVLDPAWWSWLGAAFVSLSTGWWILAVFLGAVLGLLVVRTTVRRTQAADPGVAHPVDPTARTPGSRRGVVIVVVSGLLLATGGSGLLLLLIEARPVPLASPAPGNPSSASTADPVVLPRVLADQHLVPPRAYDDLGRPRTTAITTVFSAEVAGREGLYGTDARTGRLVRLDDLPGLPKATESFLGWLSSSTSDRWPANAAISPNGRFLSNGEFVIDLQTARVTVIPEPVPVARMKTLAEAVAVLNDGSVLVASETGARGVISYPPPGSERPATWLAGLQNITSVQTQPGGVLAVQSASFDGPDPQMEIIDLGVAGPVRRVLPGVDQQEQVAVSGGTLLRRNTRGQLELRAVSDPSAATPTTAITLPGAVDAFQITNSTDDEATLVALGVGAKAPLAVLRVPLDLTSGQARQLTELTEVDLNLIDPSSSAVTFALYQIRVASDLVAVATLVDLPNEPSWVALTEPRWRTAAVLSLIVGSALLLVGVDQLRSARGRRNQVQGQNGSP